MKKDQTIQQRVSPVRTTMIVVLSVSLMYPVFFAYIDSKFYWEAVVTELLFTTLRLTSITAICFGVIWLSSKTIGKVLPRWLLHLLELVLALFCTFWFIIFFTDYIENPITKNSTSYLGSWEFRRHLGLYEIATVFVYILISGLNYYHQAQQKAALAEKLQRDYAQVRLQALKSQVNPHFLFNSLSVLSSLVHVDAELSEKFIQQLSKAYRYILEQKDAELVSLQEEFRFLDAYFFLLQIRFDQKVRLVIDVSEDVRQYHLPPLTLQLLVENAVKHNKMSAAEPLTINIGVADNYLVVQNNLNLRKQDEPSTGIGLENIQKRYALLSPQKLMIQQSNGVFSVQVPLIKVPS